MTFLRHDVTMLNRSFYYAAMFVASLVYLAYVARFRYLSQLFAASESFEKLQ